MAPRLANEGFAGDATLRSRVGDACAYRWPADATAARIRRRAL